MVKQLILNLSFLLAVNAYAEKVLIVGDSHSCGTFGVQLIKDFRLKGDKATMYCAPGKTIYEFLTGVNMAGVCKTYNSSNYDSKNNFSIPINSQGKYSMQACPELKFEKMLIHENPDKVVIALGTNSLGRNRKADYDRMTQMIQDFKTSSGSQTSCDWISPPRLDWGKGSALKFVTAQNARKKQNPSNKEIPFIKDYSIIIENVRDQSQRCHIIDSYKYTQLNQTADGIHRYGAPAIVWANGVFSEIK